MLMLFRTRRARELMRNSDSVSFDSFTNDYGANNRVNNESSLTSRYKESTEKQCTIKVCVTVNIY